MSRPVFWPSDGSYCFDSQGSPVAGSHVKVYTAQHGGTQITDLVYVDASGTSIGAVPSGILVSDQDGLIPAFAGPDGGALTIFGNHGVYGTRIALSGDPTNQLSSGSGAIADGSVTPAKLSSGVATSLAGNAAFSGTYGPAVGSDNWLKAWGSNIDALIRATTITRDGNQAATGASVIWPDGTAGLYAGTASTGTLGAIDSYTVTYLGTGNTPATTDKTVVQPPMTRNSGGAVTTRPALTVS